MYPSHGALTARGPRAHRAAPRVANTPYSLVKLLAVSILHPALTYARPLIFSTAEDELPKSPDDPGLWVYLGTAIALVLLGGAFAGLTIALMGQDEIYLQVIASSGEGSEKRNAKKVLRLLRRGKHWVLVTLLLSNVITNETLPIVLDRSLGGGWPAVVSSTVLIVIFGEIAPQSVCVRYGLTIGAWMAPFVLGLMWIMAPIAWPTAKLLDWLLGEDHGTTYKKAGLKTLVTLHKSLGASPTERLNQDEVTIISAVLDLKEKAVGDIMTPMEDVFTMSVDTVLDEDMMDTILSQGYSRIPIHAPDDAHNFIGMLLVKILITYDPEDCLRVRDFALATLPETAPETSCLDIVNFFQEGKSHMVLVSDYPGQDHGALGVVTLEDVIEELIGEEIIDESDVFIDVHRAIRRIAPAPRTRYMKPSIAKESVEVDGREVDGSDTERPNGQNMASRKSSSIDNARETTFLLRRLSSEMGSPSGRGPITMRGTQAQVKEHLKHLGPSNVASRPKATRFSTVKIKPGVDTIQEGTATASEPTANLLSPTPSRGGSPKGGATKRNGLSLIEDEEGEAMAASQDYGTTGAAVPVIVQSEAKVEDGMSEPPQTAAEASEQARKKAIAGNGHRSPGWFGGSSRPLSRTGSSSSTSTVGSLPEGPYRSRRAARSGSITESTVNIGGMKKVVLELHSSSETDNGDSTTPPHADDHSGDDQADHSRHTAKKSKKKRTKKKGKKKSSTENTPLLG